MSPKKWSVPLIFSVSVLFKILPLESTTNYNWIKRINIFLLVIKVLRVQKWNKSASHLTLLLILMQHELNYTRTRCCFCSVLFSCFTYCNQVWHRISQHMFQHCQTTNLDEKYYQVHHPPQYEKRDYFSDYARQKSNVSI